MMSVMVLLYSAVLCSLLLVICNNVLPVGCQDVGNSHGNRAGPPIHGVDDVEAADLYVHTLEQRTIAYSTPPTPRPEDVNCHFEIPTTVRVGGTCVPFRPISSMWVCQSGANAVVSNQCRHLAWEQSRQQRSRTNNRYRRMRRHSANP